ncbi:hypothetical protein C8J57DRAFT_1723778 [Mycena rebaudengoi]|nr:hypothetical protein C8J57DRAFT_1723778 [Mycena rebaudengoi]
MIHSRSSYSPTHPSSLLARSPTSPHSVTKRLILVQHQGQPIPRHVEACVFPLLPSSRFFVVVVPLVFFAPPFFASSVKIRSPPRPPTALQPTLTFRFRVPSPRRVACPSACGRRRTNSSTLPPSQDTRLRASLPTHHSSSLALRIHHPRSFPPLPYPSLTHPHNLQQSPPAPPPHPARLSRRRATLQKAVLTAGVHAAALRALADDELAREQAGGGADAEVDVGEAGTQGEWCIAAAVAQHVPGLVEAWRAAARGTREAVNGAGGAEGAACADDDVLPLNLATIPRVVGARHAGRCLIGSARNVHLHCGSLQSFWENRLHQCAVLVGLAGEDERGGDGGGRQARCAGAHRAVEVVRGAEPGHAEGAGHAADAAHFDKHVVRERLHAISPEHFMVFPARRGAAVRGGARRGISVRTLRGLFSMRALV